MDLKVYEEFLGELMERSGDFIRPWFGNRELVAELKEDESPVTVADRGAEELMRGMIEKKFPGHGIIGEEFGKVNEGAEWVWVLDPIDGTKSFVSACPLFGTLVGLLHEGVPVLGGIHQPILRQLMVGDGKRTLLNEREVRVRECARIEEAVVLTSDPLNPAKFQDGAAWERVASRARVVRTWGDCYGYLLLASGWADVMCDPIVNFWDIQALVPVVRGAGGVITDWQGGDAAKGKSLVAAGAGLHGWMVEALNAG